MRINAFRLGFIFGMIAFGITLAIIIGQRLSSEAMAVLLGVVTGIVSSVPTSLLIVWIATRNIAERIEEVAHSVMPPAAPTPTPKEEPMPRMVLVQPSTVPIVNAYAPQQGWAQAAASPMSPPRRFTVIGGNDESTVRISEVE